VKCRSQCQVAVNDNVQQSAPVDLSRDSVITGVLLPEPTINIHERV